MRDTIINTVFLVGAILFFASCEKQELVGDPGTPVFMAEVPFQNEETFEVVAGDDLFYMFASHQDVESSIVHSGLFGKEDICEEACAENFAIKIVQKHTLEGSEPLTGKYDFYSIPKDGFKHDFAMESTDNEKLDWTTWRVGNQSHTGQRSISISSDNAETSQESIQLLYDVPGQFIVQFDRPILPTALDCEVEFKVNRVVNEGIYLELSTDSPFSFVNWSNGASGHRIFIDFSTQIYTANLFDASGCQTKMIINFKTQNITQDYAITLHQESYMFSTPDNSDRSVIVEYTDGEGEFFTSSIVGQILPFEFNVLNVEEYKVNELGEPTWKLDAEFDCILFGENGSTKRILDGKAVFAVSY